MVLGRVHFAFCGLLVFQTIFHCDGQLVAHKSYDPMSPLPFPTCRADNIDCLRRSLRTFLFLMDGGYFGMQPIDPVIINSVALSLPEQQTSFLLRRVNVTGARWTKLVGRRGLVPVGRVKNPILFDVAVNYLDGDIDLVITYFEKFDLEDGKNGVIFRTDLHLSGQISMEVAGRREPHNAYITMDIQGAESNITYAGMIHRGIDNEDYIVIGPERTAVRNMRIPSYFLQPNSEDSYIIDEALQMRPSILDHFSNEITAALMHSVVDNFRLFSAKVPIKHYYKYYNK